MQHPHEPVNRALFTPVVDNRIRVGDIVVTAVADHYVIGRVTRDGNRAQDVLAWETTCPGSVETALNIAGKEHKVFLYWLAGSNTYRIVPALATPPSLAKIIDQTNGTTAHSEESADLIMSALRYRAPAKPDL